MPNSPKTSDIDVESFLRKNEKLDKERDAPHIDKGRATRRGFNFSSKPYIIEISDPHCVITPEMLSTNENKDNKQEADMSGNITKTELEALLRANKSEVDVVAAEMKKDIAEFKSFQAQQFATLNSTLSDIKGQVTSTNAELTAVKGQIDGMKTSYASIQWMVGAILMVLALILALPQIQSYLKSSEQPEQVVQTVPTQTYSAPQPVPQEPAPEPQKAPAAKQ